MVAGFPLNGLFKFVGPALMNEISQLPNVAWAAVVTGRYDIMAEVICMGGMDELYQFTTETILKIGNVVRSETFIIMKSRQNWLHLPDGAGKTNPIET